MNQYNCKNCTDKFETEDLLKDHMQTAHNDKGYIFTCTICSKKFKAKGRYMDHLKIHTMGDVRYECSLYPCFFKNRGHLKNHMDEVHDTTKKKIHRCNTCSKKFESKAGLNSHIKYHITELTLIKCSFCSRVYASKHSLKWHVHINHNKDFKRSQCPYCPSDFKWPHHLKCHIRQAHIEKGYAPSDLLKKGLSSIRRKTNDCVVCDKKFQKKLDLMLHLKNDHNQELDIFVCCICPAVFSLRNSLIIHLEDHTRKKTVFSHKCEQCHPVPNPIPFVINDEAEDIVTDNRTEIEKEIIDFEITLMENEEIRRLVKARTRHERRKQIHIDRKKQMLLKYHDSESENDVEFTGFIKGDEGSINEKDVTYVCEKCDNENCSCNQMVTVPDENHKNSDLDNGVNKVAKICLQRIDFDADINSFLHKCNMCKATFSLNSSLDEHMKFSHGTCEPDEENNILEKSIEEKSSKSSKTSSSSQEKELTANDKCKKRKDKIVKQKIYTCHICSKNFKESMKLNHHLKIDHEKSAKKLNYGCKICKAKFFHSAQYANHMRFNHREKVNKGNKRKILPSPKKTTLKKNLPTAVPSGTEKCGECNVFFSNKLELLRHISDVHMALKPTNMGVYWCCKCNVEFTSKKQIEAHYKSTCS